MSVDPTLLARYLAQVGELGGADLFLDSLTAREARRLIAAAARGGAAGAGSASASYDPAARGGAASVAREAAAGRHAQGEIATREQARAALSAMFAEAAAPAGLRTHAAPVAAEAATSPAARALRVLEESAQTCTRCRLAEGRTHVVFGDGTADAEVVVVGEAPGQEEDRRGLPFVGRAGIPAGARLHLQRAQVSSAEQP
jgi:hypothetical protein